MVLLLVAPAGRSDALVVGGAGVGPFRRLFWDFGGVVVVFVGVTCTFRRL